MNSSIGSITTNPTIVNIQSPVILPSVFKVKYKRDPIIINISGRPISVKK